MEIRIKETDIIVAAEAGMDDFVQLFYDRTMQAIGGQLTADTMSQLSADQVTLIAYMILREEVMDGGFIQLIHNGYGPFIFLNPFAKAMRLWGLHDFSKLIYRGRKLYEEHAEALTRDCTDEEFMALFEQYPDFDDLDDEFVETEEMLTALVAQYIDEHIANFATVEQ